MSMSLWISLKSYTCRATTCASQNCFVLVWNKNSICASSGRVHHRISQALLSTEPDTARFCIALLFRAPPSRRITAFRTTTVSQYSLSAFCMPLSMHHMPFVLFPVPLLQFYWKRDFCNSLPLSVPPQSHGGCPYLCKINKSAKLLKMTWIARYVLQLQNFSGIA